MVICKGDGKFKTKTNASGHYEVINLNEGKWKLQVDADGFRKEKSMVLITGEGAYEKHLELDPK